MTPRWSGILMVCGALCALGCERRTSVQNEVTDLKAAQNASPKVAEELRRELEQKKSEVVQLEEKLALAERGVTDDVTAQRNELKEAVKNEQRQVQQEAKEAQEAAQKYNADAERARRELEASQAPERVQAEVRTERKVIPSQTQVTVEGQQQQVPIQTNRITETRRAAPSDGTSAPQPAEAPQRDPSNR